MEVLEWPDKGVDEKFPNGADWTALLDGEDIVSVEAEVIDGVVTIDDPVATFFDEAIQTVWVSDGEPGAALIRCTMHTTDGRIFYQDYRFRISE